MLSPADDKSICTWRDIPQLLDWLSYLNVLCIPMLYQFELKTRIRFGDVGDHYHRSAGVDIQGRGARIGWGVLKCRRLCSCAEHVVHCLRSPPSAFDGSAGEEVYSRVGRP